MILHFTLGDVSVDPTKVGITTFKNDKNIVTKFISLRDIKQKLRLNAKFLEKRKLTNSDLIVHPFRAVHGSNSLWTATRIRFNEANFDDNNDPNLKLKWVNNSRNFTPMLIGTKTQESEEVIIYVTIPVSFKILGYYSPYSMLSTYFVKDTNMSMAGCVIVTTRKQLEENELVFSMNYFDRTDNTIKTATIKNVLSEDFAGSVVMSNVTSNKITDLEEKNEKFKTSMRFKVRSVDGTMLTTAYVTTADKHAELESALNKKIAEKKCPPDPTIFVVEDMETVDDVLDFAASGKYKAITLYEINIPREKFKERKIYNVFKYNSDTDSVVALI
jgi:hypothetical protein